MKVGLFIPCYMNELYPHVALATYKLLQRYVQDLEYPLAQTCCAQPLYNSGSFEECKSIAKHFVEVFQTYDYVVAPSGSCIAMVKHNYKKLGFEGKMESKCFELVEFLVDILKIDTIKSDFKGKVGLHNSCHGLRDLNLSRASELNIKPYSKVLQLLNGVEGLEIFHPKRVDECCGFGGTFAVNEVDVSTQMGNDRLDEHLVNNVEYITGVDVSCLMHLQGLIDRQKLPLKTIHIAEILEGESQ